MKTRTETSGLFQALPAHRRCGTKGRRAMIIDTIDEALSIALEMLMDDMHDSSPTPNIISCSEQDTKHGDQDHQSLE